MSRYSPLPFLILFLSFASPELFSQFLLPYGDIKLEELSNKPYLPDPGADAVVISDIGTGTLNYRDRFYLEFERDVRIRIVNSNGFDRADIEIPIKDGDALLHCRASTFNLRNGEKVETRISKKSFIIENTSILGRTLKINFPDVHEGSVIEYSYIMAYFNDAVYSLIPWEFQSDIPVILSALTLTYPEACTYKRLISGSAKDVSTSSRISQSYMLGIQGNVLTDTWYARNVESFRNEPYLKSEAENLTKIEFELASINFPGNPYTEVTPTYKSLTEKLLARDDFGAPLKTRFKSLAEKITIGQNDELSRLKKIHEYISSNILWNGVNDYTASAPINTILRKKKGNSADINMLLIDMLRSLNIKADPVILSTRSNGSLNMYSAMIQQFDYLIAYVTIGNESYLVDACEPLRPFSLLPFECLNDAGRLIILNDSKFVDLKNKETPADLTNVSLVLNPDGNISGSIEKRYTQYSALNIREIIKLESQEGYIDMIKSQSGNIKVSDSKIENENDPYTDLVEKYNFTISGGSQLATGEIILNPFQLFGSIKNPFISPERKFPVDFGSPVNESTTITIKLPDGYSVNENPEDYSFKSKGDEMIFDFKFSQKSNELTIKYDCRINKTRFELPEYDGLRNFYLKMFQKSSELIILKRNPLN
jgi:transglutaminase-like putative cysteine protease